MKISKQKIREIIDAISKEEKKRKLLFGEWCQMCGKTKKETKITSFLVFDGNFVSLLSNNKSSFGFLYLCDKCIQKKVREMELKCLKMIQNQCEAKEQRMNKSKLLTSNQQRKGQLLVNYVRIKHKCRNEDVHIYLWNMTDKEFQQVLKTKKAK